MRNSSIRLVRLRSGVSFVALVAGLSLAASAALAQDGDIGTVNIDSAHQGRPAASAPSNEAPAAGALPISSPDAIGNNAPVGSAPALSTSQAPLNATEPTSIVSRKIIEDVIPTTGDYNDVAKFTPNFSASNPNGPLGDSVGSWRGFTDGQYNITFDGIPFGDANDPSHHSAAYFPPAFLGQMSIDRGPGMASQVGYATFGGTMGMNSLALSDTFGGNVEMSLGNFGTAMEGVSVQSGYNKEFQTRALIQYEHSFTDGAQTLAHVNQNQFLLKVEKQIGDVTATVFGNYGTEQYNNTNQPTWQQAQRSPHF